MQVERWKRLAGAWNGAEPSADEVAGWRCLMGGGGVELRESGRRWAVLRDGAIALFGVVPDGGEMRFAGLLALGVSVGDEDVTRRDG